MKHELNIYCFDQWWQAEIEDTAYKAFGQNTYVVISPGVTFYSKIIYDKTIKKLIRCTTNATPEQIEMEVWMLNQLPVLNLERRAFERTRKSFDRKKKSEQAFDNVMRRNGLY